MDSIYAREPLPRVMPRSIFLAGPTPRSDIVTSWRPAATEVFRRNWFSGTLIIPEDRPDADGVSRFRGNYDEQVAWELEALQKASVIMAWVPRELVHMPAFTTNVEFGNWWDSGKLVYGAPIGTPGNRYIEWYVARSGMSAHRTLPDTITAALRLLRQFEDDATACAFCRIAHSDPQGQVEITTDHGVVFTPLSPCVPGHKLVVPRLHIASAADNPGIAAQVFQDAATYVRDHGLQANLITSVGPDATQTMFHLHVHIVPRSAGDGVLLPWSYQRH
ncbi:HIT domain-containing protein [Candidatus Saccharibacteria bacterium]|nr:MAG: HIT domain-containing protein [Candidatus Saccharibacteria bacterium]